MNFSINTSSLIRLHSFHACQTYWDRGLNREIRVTPDGFTLSKTRKDVDKQIVQNRDGSFGLRYHDTDLVTYHPDESITVEGWQSVSSGLFANYFLPDHVWVDMNNRIGPALLIGTPGNHQWHTQHGGFIHRGCGTRIRRTEVRGGPVWELHPEGQWGERNVPRIDRKEARAALAAHNWSDFRTMTHGMTLMGGLKDLPFRHVSSGRREKLQRRMSERDVIICMDQGWEGFMRILQTNGMFKAIVPWVREVIYRYEQVGEHETVTTFDGRIGLNTLVARDRRIDWV